MAAPARRHIVGARVDTMANFGPFNGRASRASLFDSPALPPAAFGGVRTRRMAGFAVDFAVVSVLALTLSIVLIVVTFGLSLPLLPSLWPLVAFFYNGACVSGRRMATPGMRLFDVELRTLDGRRPSFLAAAAHGVMLYLSGLFPPVFLVSLVTPDKRCLHDMLAGLIAVRRPD